MRHLSSETSLITGLTKGKIAYNKTGGRKVTVSVVPNIAEMGWVLQALAPLENRRREVISRNTKELAWQLERWYRDCWAEVRMVKNADTFSGLPEDEQIWLRRGRRRFHILTVSPVRQMTLVHTRSPRVLGMARAAAPSYYEVLSRPKEGLATRLVRWLNRQFDGYQYIQAP